MPRSLASLRSQATQNFEGFVVLRTTLTAGGLKEKGEATREQEELEKGDLQARRRARTSVRAKRGPQLPPYLGLGSGPQAFVGVE